MAYVAGVDEARESRVVVAGSATDLATQLVIPAGARPVVAGAVFDFALVPDIGGFAAVVAGVFADRTLVQIASVATIVAGVFVDRTRVITTAAVAVVAGTVFNLTTVYVAGVVGIVVACFVADRAAVVGAGTDAVAGMVVDVTRIRQAGVTPCARIGADAASTAVGIPMGEANSAAARIKSAIRPTRVKDDACVMM